MIMCTSVKEIRISDKVRHDSRLCHTYLLSLVELIGVLTLLHGPVMVHNDMLEECLDRSIIIQAIHLTCRTLDHNTTYRHRITLPRSTKYRFR